MVFKMVVLNQTILDHNVAHTCMQGKKQEIRLTQSNKT